MKQSIFGAADILLPKNRDEKHMQAWSVIACDQYTSDGSYWEKVKETVGDLPSTFRMILPEQYLGKPEEAAHAAGIEQTMRTYQNEVLELFPDTMIYLERTLLDGSIRHGVLGKFDLEAYDYNKGATSAIRATEGTVLSRIPPRVKIRESALIEMPHVMMLINDPENNVIKAAAKAKGATPLYDFDLMQNGGHIVGWELDRDAINDVDGALAVLAERAKGGLIYAVGDGNHSLAAAKAYYESLKRTLGTEAAMAHPARYALAEIVNVHDEALVFEPIYRVLFGLELDSAIAALRAYYRNMVEGEAENAHIFTFVAGEKSVTVSIPEPPAHLPVGTMQKFIDDLIAENPRIECDYIHGEDATRALAQNPHCVGILFSGMEKNDLFETVICDGALPRKTFSMGEADEKRFYLEARSIR